MNCHPFIGITFLASKQAGLPIGRTIEMRLDGITKSHLEMHHRLDPNSEYFFQPFKSLAYWVSAKYSSSGLQAINTQTFKDAFIHQRNSRRWRLTERYVAIIHDRILDAPGHGPASLAALAVWLGKGSSWNSTVDMQMIIQRFRDGFNITDEELELFETSTHPPRTIPISRDEPVDFQSPCENTTLILLAIEISVPWRSVLPGR